MKTVLGYALTCVIALLYLLFIDIKAGSIFLAILAIAPFLSLFMTTRAIKNIEFTIDKSKTVLNKGVEVPFSADFSVKGFIPTPFINVKLFNTDHFKTSDVSDFFLSLASKKPVTIEQEYTASICGVGKIGIEEITVSDFLGLKKFCLYRNNNDEKNISEYNIYPDIPETEQDNPLIRSVCEEVAYDDNEESEETAISFSGVPGFEHRNYMPGDPLKKINWKLSMKKNQVMVRLDESQSMSKVNLVIDYSVSQSYSPNMYNLIRQQKIIEASLALLETMVSFNLEINVYYFLKGSYKYSLVKTVTDIYTLQHSFCELDFMPSVNKMPRIPVDLIKENRGCLDILMFSCNFDSNLLGEINSNQSGLSVEIIIPERTGLYYENTWLIDENYNIIKI